MSEDTFNTIFLAFLDALLLIKERSAATDCLFNASSKF